MSKNVGIVRRLDNLGRVTIPMELKIAEKLKFLLRKMQS